MVICSWQTHFTHFAKPQRHVAMKDMKKSVSVLLFRQTLRDAHLVSLFKM